MPDQPFASLDGDSFRALLVDDNVGSAKILGVLFNQLGQGEVEFAHSGRDAIEKARTFAPDIVVLDLVLGDVSGMDVARTLRATKQFENTLVVALSGNSAPEHKAQTEAAGFDLHLAKPVSADQVREILARRRTMGTEGVPK